MIEDYTKFHNDGGVHIEDEVLEDAKQDNDNDPNHISIDDVSELIEKPPEGTDTYDYVMKHNLFIMEHKVKRVNKYMNEIKSLWEDAKPMEMIVAFDESNGDIDILTENLQQNGFKQRVKSIVSKKLRHEYSETDSTGYRRQNGRNYDQMNEDDDGNDDDYIDDSFSRADDYERAPQRKHTRAPSTHFSGVIPPCPSNINEEEWNSWSDARRNSYLKGMEYPNSYFYRHLPPGEVQKNGSWSPSEKEAFMKRLKEFRGNSTTMNGDWGLFSRTIPGRVGYQCANFYRKLVESGEVYDSNYVKGEEGKIHHKSRIHNGKIIVRSHRTESSENIGDVEAPPPKPKKIKKNKIIEPNKIRSLHLVLGKKREEEQPTRVIRHFIPIVPVVMEEQHTNEQSNSEERQVSRSNSMGHLSRYESWALQNPLPDMLDSITGEKIRVPAISPDGYVLDYNTWLESLKTNKENPFTRAHLNKRQLVVLTKDNIDEYRDKIVNFNSGA